MDENQALHQDHMLVLVAGYPHLEAARHDFAALTEEVKQRRFPVKGAALLTRDDDGTPTVVEIGNHLGRKGAGWGASIGILVGIFAAPVAGSVVLGAAAGAMFASHEINRVLEAGTGAVVVILPPGSLVFAERDLTGAESKSIVRLDKSTITSLEKEVERALHEHQAQASADSVGTSS